MTSINEELKEILDFYKSEIYSKEEAVLQIKKLIFPFMSIENIVSLVCKQMAVIENNFYSKRRSVPLPECRQIVTILAYENGYNYPEIAVAIGRSHSSIIVGRQKFENRMEVDEKLRKKFLKIKELLK